MASQRVLIVGAGPGGLAAAMLLSRAGVGVTVIERLPTVGGRTRTIRAGEFAFDMGPTFFLYPQVLREIFAACGRDLDEEVDLIRLDPQYHLVFGSGGAIHATGEVGRMAEQISALDAGDAEALERFMLHSRAKLDAMEPVLQQPFLSFSDLLKPSLLRALPKLRPWLSVDQELNRYFRDPRVRLAFSFQSKYLGMSPFQCPSLFTILSFMEYEHGVFHPRGGCGAVMEKMAEIATELGAEIRTGEAVEEILVENGRAVGVRTGHGEYRADALVINSDFAQTMTQLVSDRARRRWRDDRIARKSYSCSTFMLYLGLDGCEDLAHHTIYLAEDYARNVAAIHRGEQVPEDFSFYVQNACVTDPSLAPPGKSTLYVLAPVANQTGRIDWATEARPFRDRLVSSLRKIGIEDVERRIRFEKVVTPADWQHDMQIYRGAVFNLAHSFSQMLLWRPRNRFEDIAGVYLVGGGTHPGSGLPVIFESARISTRLMAKDLGFEVPAAAAPTAMPLPLPVAGGVAA